MKNDPDALPNGWLDNTKADYSDYEGFRPRYLCPVHARYYRHADSDSILPREVAEMLGVSDNEVRRMRANFQLPPCVPTPSFYGTDGASTWWRGAIEEWMNEQNWPEGREARPTKPA